MSYVRIGVWTACDSQQQQLSSWAGGILTIAKIITEQLNKSEQICSYVPACNYIYYLLLNYIYLNSFFLNVNWTQFSS